MDIINGITYRDSEKLLAPETWTQDSHDEAATRIVEIASKFHPDKSMAVMDLARARLALQDAISERIRSESREENRF